MRKSFAFYLCLFLILAGCGETSTSPSPVNPTGTYTVNYTEQSGGTCDAVYGPQPASTITIAGSSPTYTWAETSFSVPTQGSYICTADKCTINVSLTGGGGTATYNVTVTSTGMTGTQALSVTDSSACSSTYNVSGTKN